MREAIRAFNALGISEFSNLLLRMKEDGVHMVEPLRKIMYDPNCSEMVDVDAYVEPIQTNGKLDIAKHLSQALGLADNRALFRNSGLWSWLSAFYFEKLIPSDGPRALKETSLYILQSEKWNRYYRHLLAFPCLTYCELGDSGRIFLRGDIHERGEVVEQLAAVYQIQKNKGVIEAATKLYYDARKDAIKKGVASKDHPGTARRFREILKQLQMTFDLNAMNGEQIVKILPAEFKKWK